MKIDNKHTFELNPKHSNAFNVEVYKDTLLKATQYLIAETKRFNNFNWDLAKVMEAQKAVEKAANITVENSDSVSAILKYSNTKTAVLNMASAKRPGGGVYKGAKAQEEALFRCSNLGLSISKKFYPLNSDELLYTKDAVFFKDVHYNDLSNGFTADVITCAAVNLNDHAIYGYNGKDIKTSDPQMDGEYIMTTQTKIAKILDIAILHKVETIILGAWGCGVFKNDPNFIATSFKDALNTVVQGKMRKEYFENIVFAVINDHNSVANNYEIFKQHLSELETV